jgi:hypothetical protein
MKTNNIGRVCRLKNRKRVRLHRRKCNLCAGEFHLRTIFDRFCPLCKERNELLKFGECFPEWEDVIAEKVPA